MTSLHHSPRGCQEGQGWGAKGSGNELQICEALLEGAPVTASPLSCKAAPATVGTGKVLNCCRVPVRHPWVSDGLRHALRPLPGALWVASVPKVSARMVGSLTRSPGPMAPSLPQGSCRAVGPTAAHRGLAGTGGSCCQLPAPGSGSTCGMPAWVSLREERWWLPSHRRAEPCSG